MQAPLTILHVVAPGMVGGCERVVQGLAIGHIRKGHDIHVAAVIDPSHRQHPFFGPLENAGVKVHPLFLSPRAYLAECRSVRTLCNKYRPSVVHTHGYRPDVLDAWVARRLGIPTVTTEHGASKMGGRTRIYEWLQMRSFRKFDAVIAVSHAIAQALRPAGIVPDRIHVIHNSWKETVPSLDRATARRFLDLPSNGFVVGWVGRLIPAKGCDIFLRAIAQLDDLHLRCAIIGDGPERLSLESLACSLQLRDRVAFRGQIEDAGALFRAFDLFVLSSRSEGTPIVLFEAGSAGVPVVATRVGGVLDVVTDREAFIVPSEDESSIASAIRSVYSDRDNAAWRADNAMCRMAERYNYDTWLACYESVYRLVMCRRENYAT